MIRPVDTFVIRLWSPADHATASDDPRGVARHVGTGRAGTFRDGGELLALLRELRRSTDLDDDTIREPDRATSLDHDRSAT